MTTIESILGEALGHAKDIPSAAAEIRDIFKSGKERLQAVRDEAKAFADGIVSRATASLDAFKSEVDKVEQEAEGIEDGNTRVGPDVSIVDKTSNPSPQPEAPTVPSSVNDSVAAEVPAADPAHIDAAVVAHDESIATGSAPEVAHSDAIAAATQAGAAPETAVAIADSVVAHSVDMLATQPAPEAAPVI